MKKGVLKVALVFICISVIILHAQSNWREYPYTPEGSSLSFPRDNGRHTGISERLEWWCFNITLQSDPPDSNLYVGKLIYLASGIRRLSLGNVVTGNFYIHHTSGLSEDQYQMETQNFGLTYNCEQKGISDTIRWTYPEDSTTFSYILKNHNSKENEPLHLKLKLVSNKPPLLLDDDGFLKIDKDNSSFYYQLTNMKATGALKWGNDTTTKVHGIVWLDRQWWPSYTRTAPYEFFSIQVDSIDATLGKPTPHSAEFSIVQVYPPAQYKLAGGELFFNRFLTIQKGEKISRTVFDDFIIEYLDFWSPRTKKFYFTHKWRFIDPRNNIFIEATPLIENQMTGNNVWEGGCSCIGNVDGYPVEGITHAELHRRLHAEPTPPDKPTNISVKHENNTNIISWLPAEQGTFPIGGYRLYRAHSKMTYPEYIGSTTATSFKDKNPPTGENVSYWVSTFDRQDEVTTYFASERAGPVMVK